MFDKIYLPESLSTRTQAYTRTVGFFTRSDRSVNLIQVTNKRLNYFGKFSHAENHIHQTIMKRKLRRATEVDLCHAV